MSAQELIELISRGGLLALLVLIIVAGARGWWVYGYQANRTMEQLDKALESIDRLSRSFEALLDASGERGSRR